ncbi:ATP synthase F1, delta subunit family protein [Zea mays]|uniref:ATP synthase F1, delta subunit family protein n=1 Tax=Zea mays TaxID=4577 RepID=A0A1D6GI54_MAIZE|nr:ATP synthase F1, delta subunit family protein [Zea mays]
MKILNQPISPGGHLVPAQPSTTAAAGRSHAHCPRWQAQTLRRDSSYVGVEHIDGTTASVPVPVPVPVAAPPPPQMVALRVLVTSAVELDARQAERIARKMRRLTGFVDLKVETAVDASLIAGFVVCYGTDDSHVIDLSVRGQLAALKSRVDSIDQTAHAHGHPHHH